MSKDFLVSHFFFGSGPLWEPLCNIVRAYAYIVLWDILITYSSLNAICLYNSSTIYLGAGGHENINDHILSYNIQSHKSSICIPWPGNVGIGYYLENSVARCILCYHISGPNTYSIASSNRTRKTRKSKKKQSKKTKTNKEKTIRK